VIAGGEAVSEFGDPVGPVFLAHPPGALKQAHAVQRTPEHLGRGPVAGIAKGGGQRVEAGAQFGLVVLLREAGVDRQLEHGLVE
jgi:hypothetical protein